jgi:DNA-binding SARP family transcriptional activator
MIRMFAALCRALVGLAVWAGVPVILVIAGRQPWPDRRPSAAQVQDWLEDPLQPDLLSMIGWGLIWLLWIAVTLGVVVGFVSRLHRRNWQARWERFCYYLPGPMQGLAATLLGTATVAATASLPAHPVAAPAPVAAGDHPVADAHTLLVSARSDSVRQTGGRQHVYVVERGDTLSEISSQRLGDAERWPEICRMNKHRHFSEVGGTLRDCDLIYPGWELKLPDDPRPPAGALRHDRPSSTSATAGMPSSSSSSASPGAPPTTTVTPPPGSTAAAARGGHTPAPSVAATTVNTPAVTTSSTPTSSMSPSSSSASRPQASARSEHAQDERPTGSSPQSDQTGLQLSPASWLPWSVATGISAAAALVWLQRRRRYTGEPDDDPPTELPPPVTTLHRALARHRELKNLDDIGIEPPPLTDLVSLPPGGTGLVGDGAHAAARAALVAVLSSGGPQHPDTRAEVIIDSATLAILLGPDVVTLGPWPRLHVTDSVDDALTTAEARLLHRCRILDEHSVNDLDELRGQAPEEEALPPIMLITETPPAGARMRAKAALALGEALHLFALLLGEWADGVTVEVAADGRTTLVSGRSTVSGQSGVSRESAGPVPPRLAVLESAAAIQILATLREAQTGEPPATTPPTIPVTVVPLHGSRTPTAPSHTVPATEVTSAIAGSGRARLRVLGPPRIEDITAEGRPLRAKALELAVYLAVHPDGAATREIGEYLEPDARISQADQRVHTNASNLRHVLGRAGTAEAKNAYVTKSAGRYRLDPATVDVDVWTLRDLMRSATIAAEPRRRALLTTACHLSTAPLAEGHDYEWVQPHRETVRRWSTEAHLMLADDLLDNDPHAASNLLDKAIGMDRYNEALYTKAMHARHALGDPDGIRTLLRALTKALADLDAEPQEDTIELAHKLRNSLDHK